MGEVGFAGEGMGVWMKAEAKWRMGVSPIMGWVGREREGRGAVVEGKMSTFVHVFRSEFLSVWSIVDRSSVTCEDAEGVGGRFVPYFWKMGFGSG